MKRPIFSFSEELVLKILGQRKMTIGEITAAMYIDEQEAAPIEPNNYVASVVRKIRMKCEYNQLPWTIVGIGGGRGGKTVWRSRRE